VLSKNPLWAALLVHFKENDCLVEGPLNNLQPSYMTFTRPKRNPATDSRYAFTALARGGWDGRWGDDGRDRNAQSAPGFRSSGRARGKDVQTDSRFDSRYEAGLNPADFPALPIPSFAPLPNYAGADDLSSVGGDSAYDSQYGGSRTSYYTQQGRPNDHRGPSVGYVVGAGFDATSQGGRG
jgi:hypothetical protein